MDLDQLPHSALEKGQEFAAAACELRDNLRSAPLSQERLTELVRRVADAADLHRNALVQQGLNAEAPDEQRVADPLCLLGNSLIGLELGRVLLEDATKRQSPPEESSLMSSAAPEVDDVLDFLSSRPSTRGSTMGPPALEPSALEVKVRIGLRNIPRTVAKTCTTVGKELLGLPKQMISELVPTGDAGSGRGGQLFEEALGMGTSWLGQLAVRLISRALEALRVFFPSSSLPDWLSRLLEQACMWLTNQSENLAAQLESAYEIAGTIQRLNQGLAQATQPPAAFARADRALELFEASFLRAQDYLQRIARSAGHLQSSSASLPPAAHTAVRGGFVMICILVADASILHGARGSGIKVPLLGWIPSLPELVLQHVPPLSNGRNAQTQ